MCSHRRVAAATRAIAAPAVVSIILSLRNGRPPHRGAPLSGYGGSVRIIEVSCCCRDPRPPAAYNPAAVLTATPRASRSARTASITATSAACFARLDVLGNRHQTFTDPLWPLVGEDDGAGAAVDFGDAGRQVGITNGTKKPRRETTSSG